MTITARSWWSEGVFWTGDPDEPIYRLDDMSDYGEDETIPWSVYAYADKDDALAALSDIESTVKSYGGSARAFVFDGRAETPLDGEGKVGYVPPAGRTWDIDTKEAASA